MCCVECYFGSRWIFITDAILQVFIVRITLLISRSVNITRNIVRKFVKTRIYIIPREYIIRLKYIYITPRETCQEIRLELHVSGNLLKLADLDKLRVSYNYKLEYITPF